jgi:CheY-like chemotaxis protein
MAVKFRRGYFKPTMNFGDVPLLLVIDDDPDQLALMRHAAARAGQWRIMTAESGAEALVQLDARQSMQLPSPDLVVTDLKMPGMTGLDLMRALHARPDTMNVPVLFLSASGPQRDRRLVHSAGAKGFFLKPIRFGDLVGILRILPSYLPHPSESEIGNPAVATDPADSTGSLR